MPPEFQPRIKARDYECWQRIRVVTPFVINHRVARNAEECLSRVRARVESTIRHSTLNSQPSTR